MDKVGGPACKRRPSRSFVSNNFAEIPAAERKKRCSLVPLFDILLAFLGLYGCIRCYRSVSYTHLRQELLSLYGEALNALSLGEAG